MGASRRTSAQGLSDKLATLLPVKAWRVEGRPFLSLRRAALLFYFRLKRKYRKDYSFYPPEESSVPIDIFMPTLEKDAEVLSHAIDYARKNIKHPIVDIYIVGSAKSARLKEIAKTKKCIFVDETSLLGIRKRDIDYSYNGFNKNGWIYKMLLNLSADNVCSQKHILILDSDTLFIAPQIFLYKHKVLFNLSDEYHQPYFDATKRIADVRHHTSRSFITHYMLFEADILQKLRHTIEERWDKPWDQAVVDNLDRSTAMAFADYECYADFYISQRPHGYYLNYWSNASYELKNMRLDDLPESVSSGKLYRSVSLHVFKSAATEEYEK